MSLDLHLRVQSLKAMGFQKECALFVQMIEPWFWFNPWGGEMHDSPWRSPDTHHKILRSMRELLVTPEHHVACCW